MVESDGDISAICLQLAALPVNEDTSTTFAAVQQVLGTVELVELILSHLPCPEALSARYVCKMWKNLIATSGLLQKGSFLKPTAEPLSFTGVWIEAFQSGSRGGLAAQVWRKQRPEASISVIMENTMREITPATIISESSKSGHHVINPFVRHAFWLLDVDYQKQYRAAAKTLGKVVPSSVVLDTLLSQPPTTRAQLAIVETSLTVVFNDIEGHIYDTIYNPAGVAIRDLVQFMQKDRSLVTWSRRYPIYAGVLESGHEETETKDRMFGCIKLRP